MAKNIYMDTSDNHINQRLASFIINGQISTWDKKNLCIYKKMYQTSKA